MTTNFSTTRSLGVLGAAGFAFIIAMGAGAAATAGPKGASLQDKRDWAEADKRLAKKTKATQKACASGIRASYHSASYKGRALPSHTRNHCESALYIVQLTCGKAIGKEAVNSKVKTVSCRFSKTGTRASLKGGALVIHIDPKKHAIIGKKKGSYSWKSAVEELL